ncbi:UDP-2,3-diacylglucosamine diphosphatase LpxI [Venenivibrio stagnispumantis]|uniref:DUF1009 domain-containing protein n=1 Tax=Venenivibrio stagnispumantis TaxID=407998 RepID=A0AA45WKN1_9AQUI|nr:UDP-2,3-diacylglucosamine diphosphatase LpxI [Venenivibrio stagnispumantis]MCW4573159.1 UDP-2,3-diacylglucosamine diphosphatase LpxI [Venenivibrio stagnispumantis]SMP08336.1 hypothetical protein SAMN06264868_10615 [Venenivibrio stagnispumantis]
MSKIGLIAGSGELPITFAKNCNDVTIFAIKSSADKDIEKYGKTIWLPFGQAQYLINSLKENNIKKLVMLGKIEHKSIILNFHKFDKRAKDFLSKLKDKRAKTILTGIIKELEKEGFEFIDPTPYLKDLLIEENFIIDNGITEEIKKDIQFGIKIAKEIANLDIGQTVVVKEGNIIAVEGIEGTDQCILRAGELAGENCVVCKTARKNQDMRYDVPVIGIKTLESMKKIKAKALAVEAGKCYLLNKEKFIETANKYKISVVSVKLNE